MKTNKTRNIRPMMSVFTLVMINVIAIDSLRGIPMGAHYGFAIVFYYLLLALVFFIPSALVSAELASAWPHAGGIYVWVREAFGVPVGFLVSWLQWIYNVCWYPTILSFLAATLAYLVCPKLASNTLYTLIIVFATYWSLTIITLFGMRASGTISNISAILGTLLPMTIVTILGIIWVYMGKPMHIIISAKSFLPKVKNLNDLVLLTGVLYTLAGIEMSAAHAQEVKNPQRDYPRALFYSTIIILLTLILSSLAVAIVLPAGQLDVLTGLLDAFRLFFGYFKMSWIMPLIAIFIMIGIIGGVGAWLIGPTKSLLIAAQDGCVPPILQGVNKKNMPFALLMMQAVIVSLLCFVFLVMPSVTGSFWILSVITQQLAMAYYVFLFAAAIYLRYKKPNVKRVYKVPFGNIGIWVIGVAGILTCLFAIFIGYIPPPQVEVGNLLFYELFLVTGFIVFFAAPLLIYKFRKRSWKMEKVSRK